MRTVRRKTWDSFAVTPNRSQHCAALRFIGMNTCCNRKKPKPTAVGHCPCGKSCSGGRSGVQKSQNGRSDMQSKVQIDQTLPQRRRPHLSRPRQQ
jgi:hypothetical protein